MFALASSAATQVSHDIGLYTAKGELYYGKRHGITNKPGTKTLTSVRPKALSTSSSSSSSTSSSSRTSNHTSKKQESKPFVVTPPMYGLAASIALQMAADLEEQKSTKQKQMIKKKKPKKSTNRNKLEHQESTTTTMSESSDVYSCSQLCPTDTGSNCCSSSSSSSIGGGEGDVGVALKSILKLAGSPKRPKQSSIKKQHHVSFSEVHVREFLIQVGDCPCSNGPPIACSNTFQDSLVFDAIHFDEIRVVERRGSHETFRLTPRERTNILLKLGYSVSDIQEISFQALKSRQAWSKSLQDRKWDKFNYMVESATRPIRKAMIKS